MLHLASSRDEANRKRDTLQKIERRRELATRLGITMNALGIRAFRIRDGLMACVESCRQRRRQI